ncbi:MAG: RsmE family RNA methyltransferase [Candidatus Rhabdochlamydia sp.]
MPAHRFFHPNLLNQETVVLNPEESHHLQHVMRVREQECIEIVDGKGTLAYARVTSLGKKETTVAILKQTYTPPASCELILAQALIRPSLLDWVIEKGTELGATQFWLFPGDLSEKKALSSQQLDRLSHLVMSGVKQSGRVYIPSIHLKPHLSKWEKPQETVLFGSFMKTSSLLGPSFCSSVIMAIGPEKGFSQQEESILLHQLEAKPTQLHTNTLRAETAAICALSLLASRMKG